MTPYGRIAALILVAMMAASCGDDEQVAGTEGGNQVVKEREDWPETFVLGVIPMGLRGRGRRLLRPGPDGVRGHPGRGLRRGGVT